MSFLSSSACVPKMACTLLPTSITPAAPRAFSRALSTWSLSATSIRSRVMQASTLTRFSRPPNAAISRSALTLAAVLVASAVTAAADGSPATVSSSRLAACSASNSSSGSRPGVRRFHHRITSRNST